MRFLIREMEYEKPVASGSLRYEQDGNPTGLVEAWRFSSALDGFHFLRVDMDANNPRNQETLLVHVLLNPDREMERMKFRYFESQIEISGDMQFNHDVITLNRIVLDKFQKTEQRQLDEIPRKAGTVFSVPPTAVLSLATSLVLEDDRVPMITLDRESSFAMQEDTASFAWTMEEERAILRNVIAVRQCSICWRMKETRLWLDKTYWPVSASFSSGLSAVEIAYWRYQSAA